MFDALTASLDGVFRKLRARGRLHPKQVDQALGEIRTALLEADVALEVVDALLEAVRRRALSEEVLRSLTPAQQVVKVVDEELTRILGGEHRPFDVPRADPAVIVVAGVQGSGKTTACAKLARHLKANGRRPVLIGADLERPAAVDQLRTLGREIGVPVWSQGRDPVRLARAGVKEARRSGADVAIVDTAGRLHVDAEMMRQARRIRDVTGAHHVLMTCDAMTGQDAVAQARAFLREVDTTGFIVTKLDGDARGGAALSMTHVTGRPIFFVGTGERVEDLEPFHPDRMAGRILGMGDVLTLIERTQEAVDAEAAAAATDRLADGSFTLEDFLVQLREMRKLGPVQDLLGMLPGVPGGRGALKDLAGAVDDAQLRRAEAIICSMTPAERRDPGMISGSRRLRIAGGAGVTTADVNALLRDFEQARRAMRAMLGGAGFPGRPRPGRPRAKARRRR
jgi:signal recognition particle subunit SRP54